MKYKVGDKVRVKKDLNEGMTYNEFVVTTPMADKAGNIVTISAVHRRCYHIVECGCAWTDEMFEPVQDELTAEEATKILGEICCENELCGGCPIGEAKGKTTCQNFQRDKTEEVLEILKQWKKDHEKKEVEVTQKNYCLVVDEERKVVHEEEIGNSDSCTDVLKNYCENHDGKFFSIMEFRCEVKQ